MPSRTVGILNFQYSTHNFGAVLQAAALEHTLRRLGHEAKHINFIGRPRVPIKRRVRRLLAKIIRREEPNSVEAGNQEAFERFRSEFLTRTHRVQTAREFRRVAREFDSIVVGSDQVWRPRFAKDPLAFFLMYVPVGVDRVSYAASFGTSTWEEDCNPALTESVRKELAKFKAVSCREDSGVNICRDAFGVAATHVLDPLLLVEQSFFDHVGLARAGEARSKVVFYKLDSTEDFLDDLDTLERAYGCAPKNIYLKDGQHKNYHEVPDWLSFISNSDVVITDSFHCICLALRFGKEIIYCPNESRGEARFDSLFNMLDINLKNCAAGLKMQMHKLIVPAGMDKLLEGKRETSLQFLAGALDG